jgi:hypothetical protein
MRRADMNMDWPEAVVLIIVILAIAAIRIWGH